MALRLLLLLPAVTGPVWAAAPPYYTGGLAGAEVNAGKADGFLKPNVTVRGMLLSSRDEGPRWSLVFDTDLLRMAAVWRTAEGEPLTMTGTASRSWEVWNRKSEGGWKTMPVPRGVVAAATAAEPGAVVVGNGETPDESAWRDPRPLAPDPNEPGRGPLPREQATLRGVSGIWSRPEIRYTVSQTTVTESLSDKHGVAVRQVRWKNLTGDLLVRLGDGETKIESASGSLARFQRGDSVSLMSSSAQLEILPGDRLVCRLTGASGATSILYWTGDLRDEAAGRAALSSAAADVPDAASAVNIPAPVQAPDGVKTATGEWDVTFLPPPSAGAAGRIIRPTGIAFHQDGRAVVCTMDGDLWEVFGLTSERPSWRLIGRGFHEPQSVTISGDGAVHVFDRNGIFRVTHDGAELLSNQWPQGADSREFPMDMVRAPDGAFFIAKGGQQLTTRSAGAGRVYEVSADGGAVAEFCTGLRQPYLGVHPQTGLLTASDQQGHWVPATPVHFLERGAYYGYPDAAPVSGAEPAVEPPACWIPHEVNQSAAGHVWVLSEKMGALNGGLAHLGYHRSHILRVYPDVENGQAAVSPLPVEFPIPLLKGAVNPVDGLLYLAGFHLWGASAPERAGLVRLRPGDKPSLLPEDVKSTEHGIVIRFPRPLDAASVEPARWCVGRWDYRRTKNYGSPHYRSDGTPGQDVVTPLAVQFSADHRSVLVRLAEMPAVMQLRVDWRVKAEDGAEADSFTCLTPHRAPAFDLKSAGFPESAPPPGTASAAMSVKEAAPAAEEGQRLTVLLGCTACHSTDGKMEGMKGPTWKGLASSQRSLSDGTSALADDAYLVESILTPAAKTARGFDTAETGMPPYAGVLTDNQVKSIVLYLQTLAPP